MVTGVIGATGLPALKLAVGEPKNATGAVTIQHQHMEVSTVTVLALEQGTATASLALVNFLYLARLD
jgi:hypothetical protein